MSKRNGITKIEITVTVAIVVVLIALLFPARQFSHDYRSCRYNLEELAEAMLAYHENYGSFPSAEVRDAEGKPLYGWRVLLLPFLEENELYEKFNLEEPWDSPHNIVFSKESPEVYQCEARYPRESNSGFCSYVMLLEPDIMPAGEDGVFITETCAEIPWSAPVDLPFNAIDAGVRHYERGEKAETGIASSHISAKWANGYYIDTKKNPEYFILNSGNSPKELREKLDEIVKVSPSPPE